jgi:hypothetical protein
MGLAMRSDCGEWVEGPRLAMDAAEYHFRPEMCACIDLSVLPSDFFSCNSRR